MRAFDFSSEASNRVPVDVIERIHLAAMAQTVEYVIVGAAARDLVVHAAVGSDPRRATLDVDVAVAVNALSGVHALALAAEGDRVGTHGFSLSGIPIDVIPYGDFATNELVELEDGVVLDIMGIAEAAANADRVRLHADLVVPVASIEAMTFLKVLAWRDRGFENNKDALDLCEILLASSEGVYADEAWEDDEALAATDYDIRFAGPYRIGRRAAELLPSRSRSEIVRVLTVEGAVGALVARSSIPEAEGLVRNYLAGFATQS